MIILCCRLTVVRRLAVLIASSGAAVWVSNFAASVVPIDTIAVGGGAVSSNRLRKRLEMRVTESCYFL